MLTYSDSCGYPTQTPTAGGIMKSHTDVSSGHGGYATTQQIHAQHHNQQKRQLLLINQM